ncbi:uncharacterized protein LY89DRAFT_674914 [Mollisia scopiformis]|uniref:AA9 family lytic polysaccharide monooxygenase n=1 Tax=Mollisia scopiformis TaxID=149040 RepID=A0A194WS47_MOLSC|nr:uncharacterized protein LY89DRAFT_674914 [Mollisia scopiformis]KUJ10798.1 hypothetical protein LY89DRAFT_674914 [Mollisia scopiformis]
MKLLILTFLLTWALNAAAHGGIYTYNISSVIYQGNPWHIHDYGPFYGSGNASGIPAGTPSIQRRWYFWPLYNLSSPNMTCNFDGSFSPTTPSLHAPVRAGETITASYNVANFNLTAVERDQWYHQYGPLLIYMARCPGLSCAGWNGEGEVWFKIAEFGLVPGAKNLRGPWMQGVLLMGTSSPGVEVRVPGALKTGAYLVRHEVVNLQSNRADGAQFYVSCAQVFVEGGEGGKVPGERFSVAFPGAYKSSDPGLRIAGNEISDGELLEEYNTTDYQFPGPLVWDGEG